VTTVLKVVIASVWLLLLAGSGSVAAQSNGPIGACIVPGQNVCAGFEGIRVRISVFRSTNGSCITLDQLFISDCLQPLVLGSDVGVERILPPEDIYSDSFESEPIALINGSVEQSMEPSNP
jgi:hypothetical protein